MTFGTSNCGPQTQRTCTSVHNTPRGPLRAEWTAMGLHTVAWGETDKIPADYVNYRVSAVSPAAVLNFDAALADYFLGNFAAFEQIAADSSGWPPFFARVYQFCRLIAPGQTLSYAELAGRAGSPRAARAVGQAMARNRLPLVIPCHRVLASGGKMGGYSGPGGVDTKRWLLALEADDRNS
ncbi:methylated-DNA--[protein]-cysteine S-methyltransferase [Planctomycetaceae bacterium SH139]